MRINITKYILFLPFLFLASCSLTKGLKDGQYLYQGTKYSYMDKENINNKSKLNNALEAIYPLPDNAGFLNIKRGFYNVYDSVGTSGFKHIVKNRLGSKPKIYSTQMMDNTQALSEKVLKDNGYFKSSVSCDSVRVKKGIKLDCTIHAGPRYRVNKIIYPYDTLAISKVVKDHHPLEFLKKEKYYLQNDIVSERAQIINTAKDNGYIYFDSRDLFFYIDTLANQPKADIYIEIRNPSDTVSQRRFILGDIKVDTKFALNSDDEKDFVYDDEFGIYFNDKHKFVKKSFVERMIVQRKGEYISDRKQKISSNRLLDLGIFKFVRNEFSIGEKDTLNQTILLTPSVTKSITGELELNNRTGNFFGTEGSVSFINKNAFRGGERFKTSLSGGIETQFGEESFINTQQVKFQTSLEIPRFIVPFKTRSSKYFLPWTIMSTGVNLQRRINYFDISDFNLKFGYKWQQTVHKFHEFYPIDFKSFYISRIDDAFKIRLAIPENIRLRESFEDKLVFGVRYAFTYNNAPTAGARDSWYIKSDVFAAGNTYGLIEKVLPGLREHFDNRVSQFVKVSTDVRKYWSKGDTDIATRFYIGAGYAYGRSTQMPYSEQFSIGGSNSLRAFSLRTVGPGPYVNNSIGNGQLIDQTGDVKLEMNLEYRFPIAGFLKGAVFLDAGNIWLLERGIENGQRFVIEDFYKSIALGTGIGTRFDFDFFVFRVDIGVPLHGPIGEEFKWLNTFDPIDRQWRKDHLKLNLGIGYPF